MDTGALCGLRFSRSVQPPLKHHHHSSSVSAPSSSSSSSSSATTVPTVVDANPHSAMTYSSQCGRFRMDDPHSANHGPDDDLSKRVDYDGDDDNHQAVTHEDQICHLSDMSSGTGTECNNNDDIDESKENASEDVPCEKKILLDLHELDNDASFAALCVVLRAVAQTREREQEQEASSTSCSSQSERKRAAGEGRKEGRGDWVELLKCEGKDEDGENQKHAEPESMRRRLRAPLLVRRLSSVMARLNFTRRNPSRFPVNDDGVCNDPTMMRLPQHRVNLNVHGEKDTETKKKQMAVDNNGNYTDICFTDHDDGVDYDDDDDNDDECTPWSSRSRATSTMTATTTTTTATASTTTAIGGGPMSNNDETEKQKKKKKKKKQRQMSNMIDMFDDDLIIESITPSPGSSKLSTSTSRPPLLPLALGARKRRLRSRCVAARPGSTGAAGCEDAPSETQAHLLGKVREENDRLRERVADLEMQSLELDTLRDRVVQLEWALDVVRDDADRVRDDALALFTLAS